ncbi:MAG: flagellar basal body rod C-terminal domain-containing protein, partial [Bryobacteraceae bacterium]
REGYPIRAQGPDKTIRIAPGQESSVTVQSDGSVTVNGSTAGRIALVDLDKPDATEKRGESYFRLVDPGYTPAAATSQVHQGKLESSNVSPAESAVRLVSIMRQFEMLQRAVSLGAEMNRKAVEEVAKVGN